MQEQIDTPSQTRWQRLFEFLFFIVLILPVGFASLLLLERLHWLSCPDGTFIAGTNRPELQKYSWVIALTAFCFLVEYWLIYFIPSTQRILGRHVRRHGRDSLFLHHFQSNASIVALCIAVPLVASAAFSNFCLDPNNIEFKAWPWSNFEQHHWQEVTEIQTACWRGSRSSWPAAYVLVMNDREPIDIDDGLRRTGDLYPELHQALKNVDFLFDSWAVEPQCRNSHAAFLRMRP